MVSLPKVSVIVPMLNEGRYLELVLDSIAHQDYPPELLEVALVDGGSADGSLVVARRFEATHANTRVLENPERIVPVALNRGIRASSGDVIVRMDAHSYYPSTYVSACVEALQQQPRASNVGGPLTTVAEKETPLGRAIALALSTVFGVGRSFRTKCGSGPVDTVPFGAFRRSVFDDVGLFDERLARNQDIEMNSRIRRAGHGVYLCSRIHASYVAKASLSWLVRQSFKNGQWVIYTARVCGGSLSFRHYAPLAATLSAFALALLASTSSLAAISLLTVSSVYALMAIAASFHAARPHVRIAAWLVLCYGLLHVSYGIGSLWGICSVNRFSGASGQLSKDRPEVEGSYRA